MQRGADRCGRVRIGASSCPRSRPTICIIYIRTSINAHASTMMIFSDSLFNLRKKIHETGLIHRRKSLRLDVFAHRDLIFVLFCQIS